MDGNAAVDHGQHDTAEYTATQKERKLQRQLTLFFDFKSQVFAGVGYAADKHYGLAGLFAAACSISSSVLLLSIPTTNAPTADPTVARVMTSRTPNPLVGWY